MFDVDTDDGAVHDWWGVVVGPVAASPQFWVESVPCGDGDGPVAGISGDQVVGGFGPR